MQAFLGLLTSKPFQKRLGRLFSHPIALLAIATIFATIAGVWLTNYYQERAWVREKRFETFRQGYREALELVDELSEVREGEGARHRGTSMKTGDPSSTFKSLRYTSIRAG